MPTPHNAHLVESFLNRPLGNAESSESILSECLQVLLCQSQDVAVLIIC